MTGLCSPQFAMVHTTQRANNSSALSMHFEFLPCECIHVCNARYFWRILMSVRRSARLSVRHIRKLRLNGYSLYRTIEGYLWLLQAKFCDSEFRDSPQTRTLKRGTPVESENLTNNPLYLLSGKQCKIGRSKNCSNIGKLRTQTGFPLVPKVVTSNDLQRRNGRYLALFHWIRYNFGVLKSDWLDFDQYILSATKM